MNVPFVDLKAQYESIKTEIDSAIRQCIEDTSFIGGKPVANFEKKFAGLLGIKNCIGVANGTDAIYIAMRMMGIGAGDEVITTATSWISTSETITQTGAKPVFVDIDPVYYTIDVKQIESRITKKTRAIIPVHIYGQAAHAAEIKRICEKHNLKMIEDCAQSHFTKENDRLIGTIGDVSTFSFFPGKNLGAYGDAGGIVTNDDALAQKMRMYANHGSLRKHEHEIEGINSRLDALQAAILDCKANHILNWTEMRRRNAALYDERLGEIPEVEIPRVRPGTLHSFHLYVIRTDRRDALKTHLQKEGIQTAIHYPSSLPNLPAYKYLGHTKSSFPVASAHQERILSIPMFAELSVDQIDHVCSSIKRFFQNG